MRESEYIHKRPGLCTFRSVDFGRMCGLPRDDTSVHVPQNLRTRRSTTATRYHVWRHDSQPAPAPVPSDTREASDAGVIGQAVHDLTTDINHRLAHPVGLDDDCAVLGRVIAKRLFDHHRSEAA